MSGMSIFLRCLIVLIGVSFPVYGKYALPWDALGNSAHMIGIGRIAGFDTSAQAVFENSAALSHPNHFSVASMYSSFMANQVAYTNFAISLPVFFGHVGVGLMYYEVPYNEVTAQDSFDEYIVVDHFDYRRGMAKVGYQFPLMSYLSGGVGLTYHFVDAYTTHANGLGLDTGLFANWDVFRVSFSAKNLLATAFRYSNAEESLPAYFRLAAAADIHPVVLYAQMGQTRDIWTYHLGAKYFLVRPDFYVSAGVGDLVTATGKSLRASVGAGMDLRVAQFFMAYETSDYQLDNHHFYFSVSTQFEL